MIDRRILVSALALAALPRKAAAEVAASPWSRDSRSAVRLLAGGEAGGHRLAGLEIVLDGETKTYWRTPGDSGVPPSFDWSGSTNVAAVAVSWPAPMRFSDGNGFSIGYKTGVVLPLAVTPTDPARPVRLSLALDYAVCDQICIPAKAAGALDLGRRPDPAATALIARFQGRVPQPRQAGFGLAVAGIDRSGPHPALLLRAEVPDGNGPVDLFAEGPDSQWVLPLPEALDGAGGERRFRLLLDGVPRGADPLGHALTFTLVAGERALEARLKPA